MSYSALDRIQMTSTSTGTSNLTLTAVTGTAYSSFSKLGVGSDFDYAIVHATANEWEIGQGTFDSATNTLVRVSVEESTNASNSLVNFSSGNKNVFIGFPASKGMSTLPPGDNYVADYQGINENQAVLRLLQRRRARGSVFSNVTVSTYSLVYTTSQAYAGGILAPNGDIHFVAAGANRGQKINTVTGAVSTYSLVWTTGGFAGYAGGVLNSIGEIHFIPSYKNFGTTLRGQKLNTGTGVVSTYSIPYSISDSANFSYFGGVLLPNGDVFFVPGTAIAADPYDKTIKVSVTGAISTLTIPTAPNTGGLTGGVLAPNGDIYFLPEANDLMTRLRGGTVWTTYTTPNSRIFGGCLGIDGNIYAFSGNSNAVLKINPVTAIITTYTKIGTSRSYAGAVLAPNGDIHFVPHTTTVGQKYSSINQTASTYSIPFSLPDFSYYGAVLAPNGDIHFIPFNAPVGMKISTGSSIPLGEAVSSFFNYFCQRYPDWPGI